MIAHQNDSTCKIAARPCPLLPDALESNRMTAIEELPHLFENGELPQHLTTLTIAGRTYIRADASDWHDD